MRGNLPIEVKFPRRVVGDADPYAQVFHNNNALLNNEIPLFPWEQGDFSFNY